MIDTHCHLNFPDKFPNPAATIQEATEAGVDRLIVIGCDPESSRAALELAKQFDGVYCAVGWHPTYTSNYTRESLDEIEEMLSHPKTVAIGEIGLDYHWDYSTPEQQKVALLDQLELAKRLGKPVVFHARDAYPQLIDILESRERLPYLFHCFGGTTEDAVRAMKLDAMFGVDGPVTYKNAGDLRQTLATIPADRLVLETDSPYLSPMPHRGKPNTPAYVVHVNAALAQVLGLSEAECAAQTTRNAERFFGLSR